MIAIGMCVDRTYLVPALATLVSLADAHDASTRRRMSVCVLSPDLTRAEVTAFRDIVIRLGFRDFRARIVRPSDDLALVGSPYVSRATYLRFAFARDLVREPYLLYLDSDILVVGDVTPPFNRLPHDRVGAVTDEILGTVGRGEALPGLIDVHPEYRGRTYFNAGALWLPEGLLAELNTGSLQAAREHRCHVFFNDQDALNIWLLRGDRSMPVPGGYNRFELGRFLEQGDWIRGMVPSASHAWPISETAVLHFIGADKPWHRQCPSTAGVRAYGRALAAARRAISRTRVPMHLPTSSALAPIS